MNDLKSGYYLCEIKSIFHDGTYTQRLYYDSDLGKFFTTVATGNITRRVVRVLDND